MPDAADALLARIERLERELADLRRQSASDVQLKDAQGRLRAQLALKPLGPELCFCDETGVARAKLTLTAEGPGLTFADERGQTRAWLGFTKEALRIGFADEHGNSRVFVGVMKSGPVAKIYDANQKIVWQAP